MSDPIGFTITETRQTTYRIPPERLRDYFDLPELTPTKLRDFLVDECILPWDLEGVEGMEPDGEDDLTSVEYWVEGAEA